MRQLVIANTMAVSGMYVLPKCKGGIKYIKLKKYYKKHS